MRVLRAVLDLLLAVLLAVALNVALAWLAGQALRAALLVGPLAIPLVGFLTTVLVALPGLLLAVLWLRDLGGAPVGPGARPVARAVLRALGALLVLMVVSLLLNLLVLLPIAALTHRELGGASLAVPDFDSLSWLGWIAAGCQLLLLLAFAPAILRRAGNAPGAAVGYGGAARWLVAAALCVAAGLLHRLALEPLAAAVATDASGSLVLVAPPRWLALAGTALLDTLALGALCLGLWYLLRRAPVQAAAAAT